MANKKFPSWVTTKTHQKMHDDFRIFLWWLWQQLGLPEPTECQYEIAYYLQHGPKRRIVMAFRGIGKSWITAAFVIWCLLRDANERIMVVSASEYKALEFCTFTKACITTLPLLNYLLAKPHQRDSTLAFDVGPSGPHQAPSVRAVGITGQMTGGRASKVVFDDIEVPNNSLTEGKREILTSRAREMGGAILMPTIGQSIGLGTPQSIQSIYGGFEERGYEIRVWPARYPDDEQEANFQGRLAPGILSRRAADPSLVGRPTDPNRFNEQDLGEREAEYGRSGFNLQFMLDTTLSDGTRFPLKFRDLIVTDIDRDVGPDRLLWASGPLQELKDVPNVGLAGDRFYAPLNVPESFSEYEGSVMVIDPSGRGKDETSYCVTKMLHGKVFVTRWGGLSGGYDSETLKSLVLIAQEQKVNLVKIESNFGDGMFTALINPIFSEMYPVTIEEYSVHTQKELRIIDKLEPAMNQHRVVMDKEIVRKQNHDLPEDAGERERYYNGFYQLAYLTKDRGALKQDDRIDILAEGVGHWVESVDRDADKAANRSHEKKVDAELQKFARGIKNLRPQRVKRARRTLRKSMR